MDWNKLHIEINDFANKFQIQIEESNLSYGNGTITTYQLNENSSIFYELKHSKPFAEHGSKLRIYSNSSGESSIKVKKSLLGKPSIKTNLELSDTLRALLSELGNRIGSFQWTTEQHHSGWPSELENTRTLKFECKRIELVTSSLDSIRKIHIALLRR